MRRSSVITIFLLVIIIICLIATLIVTNLTNKEEINEVIQENNQAVNEEEPTIVSLDNQIVKDMYYMVNGSNVNLFHYIKKGYLTVDDLSYENIKNVAYFYDAKNYVEKFDKIDDQLRDGKLERKYIEESIKKVFGNIEFDPIKELNENKENNGQIIKYDPNEDVYYEYTGFGGGTDFSVSTAFTKVEEYSDKYIVTEKLVSKIHNYDLYYFYPYYGTGFQYSGALGYMYQDEIENLDITYDLYSDSDIAKKIISKFYDEATEYRHTFIKNEDGSFYWQKTEIVK